MAVDTVQNDNEKLVQTYFSYIRDLRTGVPGSVEKLVDLWTLDGTFEFAGSPPVVGTFHGRAAIQTLYKNRFSANKMPLALEADANKPAPEGHAALGVVDTEVKHIRHRDGHVIAGWTTVMGTADGRGFQVAGSHTFAFRDGKISSLKVVVSPRPEETKNLKLANLGVEDVGRLALAAWAVV
jgi:ketosteroid isomerase-like protein